MRLSSRKPSSTSMMYPPSSASLYTSGQILLIRFFIYFFFSLPKYVTLSFFFFLCLFKQICSYKFCHTGIFFFFVCSFLLSLLIYSLMMSLHSQRMFHLSALRCLFQKMTEGEKETLFECLLTRSSRHHYGLDKNTSSVTLGQ